MNAAVRDISTHLAVSLQDNGLDAPLPGIHPHVDFADYARWKAASNSRLSILREKTPAHLKAEMETPTDTDALRQGRAIHCAVLEPDSFASRYMMARQCSATTKKGEQCSKLGCGMTRGAWLCGTHGGQRGGAVTVLSEADYLSALRARDAVWAHPMAKQLLSGHGEAEVSLSWADDETGIPCKARLDRRSPHIAGGAIVDLKKTRDASKRAFERAIYTYGYHLQAGWYIDGCHDVGLAAEHFVIIAQEDFPPYATAVYRVNEAAIDAGRETMRPLVRLYAECVEKNEWPGYAPDVRDVFLPDYAWHQVDQPREDTV